MGRNKVTLALGFCALALVVSSLIYFQNHNAPEATDLSSTSPDKSEQTVYRGPVHDCVFFDVLYRRSNQVSSVCSGNYVHFFPDNMDSKSAKSTTGEIKIGSFNLFHLGDNVAPLKHIGLMAKVLDQWDVAGVQEMMPLTSEWAYSNMSIYEVLKDGNNVEAPFKNWNVVMPGYLQLLLELQKLDSSWALILQPVPEGEGTTGEMAGFFYRSKKVRLKEWGYCPADRSIDVITGKPVSNFACLLQIPKDQRRLMSRVAFTAYFESGNFDFVGVTTHVRFNAAVEEADRKEQAQDLCSFHVNEAKCKPAKDEVGRFYEVTAIANQFKDIIEISGDKDLIFSGDFNLQDDAKSKDLWEAALKPAPGYVVTQTAPTTLSIKANKTVSNYDHFIIDPNALKECDMKSIRAFDFTTADTSADPVMREIAKFLKPEMQNLLLQDQQNFMMTLAKYQGGRGKTSAGLRALNDKEKAEMGKDYTETAERMRANKTGALLDLLSDHVPVEMKCRIPARDDD